MTHAEPLAGPRLARVRVAIPRHAAVVPLDEPAGAVGGAVVENDVLDPRVVPVEDALGSSPRGTARRCTRPSRSRRAAVPAPPRSLPSIIDPGPDAAGCRPAGRCARGGTPPARASARPTLRRAGMASARPRPFGAPRPERCGFAKSTDEMAPTTTQRTGIRRRGSSPTEAPWCRALANCAPVVCHGPFVAQDRCTALDTASLTALHRHVRFGRRTPRKSLRTSGVASFSVVSVSISLNRPRDADERT